MSDIQNHPVIWMTCRHTPVIEVLDEPTSGLDSKAAEASKGCNWFQILQPSIRGCYSNWRLLAHIIHIRLWMPTPSTVPKVKLSCLVTVKLCSPCFFGRPSSSSSLAFHWPTMWQPFAPRIYITRLFWVIHGYSRLTSLTPNSSKTLKASKVQSISHPRMFSNCLELRLFLVPPILGAFGWVFPCRFDRLLVLAKGRICYFGWTLICWGCKMFMPCPNPNM